MEIVYKSIKLLSLHLFCSGGNALAKRESQTVAEQIVNEERLIIDVVIGHKLNLKSAEECISKNLGSEI
jgi:hypothetical protein